MTFVNFNVNFCAPYLMMNLSMLNWC